MVGKSQSARGIVRGQLTILGFIGFRKMYKRDPASVVPYAILFLVFPLVYYVANPEMGYREAYDPELVILIACAIVSWRSSRERQRAEDLQPALTSESTT